jgi:dephospho-CoA kinase
LKELNAIVHPATRRDFDRWSIELSNKGYNKGFLLKEAAILFEAGSDKSLEGVIDVYAPKKLRLERVQNRDSVDSSAVLARMANQWPDSKKMFASDFIIYNDGSHMLIPQVQQAISFFNSRYEH